ncbi:hypothetical protein S245_036729, partial [Arachis hypogaea]
SQKVLRRLLEIWAKCCVHSNPQLENFKMFPGSLRPHWNGRSVLTTFQLHQHRPPTILLLTLVSLSFFSFLFHSIQFTCKLCDFDNADGTRDPSKAYSSEESKEAILPPPATAAEPQSQKPETDNSPLDSSCQ